MQDSSKPQKSNKIIEISTKKFVFDAENEPVKKYIAEQIDI